MDIHPLRLIEPGSRNLPYTLNDPGVLKTCRVIVIMKSSLHSQIGDNDGIFRSWDIAISSEFNYLQCVGLSLNDQKELYSVG